MEVVSGFKNKQTTYLPDGSLYYGSDYANATPDEVEARVLNWNHSSYRNFETCSQERIGLFEYLIDNLSDYGKVQFYCAPFHPAYWPVFVKTCPGGVVSIKYITEYARKKNIQIIGGIQPDECNATKDDFYDAVHVRKEAVERIFFEKYEYKR